MTKIYSRTYEKEFEIELCPKEQGENFDVISHKSLQDIHDVELRGELTTKFEVLNDNPNHSVVKVVISNKDGFAVEEIGEKTKCQADTEIGKSFPTTTAYCRAFDRAMIRILGFVGKFYSDQELSDKPRMIKAPAMSDLPGEISDVPSDIFSESEEPVTSGTIEEPEYLEVPETVDELPAEETAEISAVEAEVDEFGNPINNSEAAPEKVKEDPGDFTFKSGQHKGKTIKELYADEKGRGYLNFVLGGDFTTAMVKNAIMKYYAANGIKPESGEKDFAKKALAYYEANIDKFGGGKE